MGNIGSGGLALPSNNSPPWKEEVRAQRFRLAVAGTLEVLHQGWIVIAEMEGHVPEWVGEEERLGRGGLCSGPGLFTRF